jgi:hypothetical protein
MTCGTVLSDNLAFTLRVRPESGGHPHCQLPTTEKHFQIISRDLRKSLLHKELFSHRATEACPERSRRDHGVRGPEYSLSFVLQSCETLFLLLDFGCGRWAKPEAALGALCLCVSTSFGRAGPISGAEIPGKSVGNDHVRATVEKVKHLASLKFFIPCRTRSYEILEHPARTEFRHDSCNTAPR